MKSPTEPAFKDQIETDDLSQCEPVEQRRVPQTLCGRFVEEVIRSLVELDASHLAALAAVAERFSEDAALRLTPGERVEMEAKMQLFAAVLAETRKNLRIFALGTRFERNYGYKAGGPLWAE